MFGVYHSGEIAIQERAGERSLAERRGSMINNQLVEGARAFLARRSEAAVAAAAPDGSLWTSFWCATPGFLRSDDDGEHIEIAVSSIAPDDVVAPLIRAGDPLGMVVIDFDTRRRLRVNGIVTSARASVVRLRVRETFGNCIKYIQRRQRAEADGSEQTDSPVVEGTSLDDDRRSHIARIDTLFVGSINPERGLDVSHRGGEPGFVRVEDERRLRIPDYAGNSMYQTLGNFESDARGSLALIDFERRRVLSLTGHAAIDFRSDDARHPTGGTGRYWTFAVDRWIERSLPATVAWRLLDRSPFNPSAAR